MNSRLKRVMLIFSLGMIVGCAAKLRIEPHQAVEKTITTQTADGVTINGEDFR